MFFSRQLPLAALIEFCRIMRLNLSAGLLLRDVMGQIATRGPRRLHAVAERIGQRLGQGKSFHEALQPEQGVFPPLLLKMADLGEQTGHLPEVLHELEDYYVQLHKHWLELRSKSTMPVMQFAFAIGVVALLIFMTTAPNGALPSLFGFRGGTGAILFLVLTAGLGAAVYLGYRFFTRRLGQQAAVDSLLLRLPVIGPCVQAMVVGRFALAMQLTLDTSLPVAKALQLSLESTGNAAFGRQANAMVAAVDRGESLSTALSRGPLMPAELLTMIACAEEGGRIVEVMRQQAVHYHEEVQRRLPAATRLATFLIWLIYAAFMVLVIFTIAGNIFKIVGGNIR